MPLHRYLRVLSLGVLFITATLVYGQSPAKPLRVGMIGLDTSHVTSFTAAINDPKAEGDLSDIKIVAGYPGGSDDVPLSYNRIKGFTETLRNSGVEIVDSIDALLQRVDVVMLESVDGRPHLAQAKPVIAAGKKLFIDKPMAASLVDVIRIFRLAKEKNVPVFSSSGVRFVPEFQALRDGTSPFGKVRNCTAYSPLEGLEHNPELFYYGVHGAEGLFTILKSGCKTVIRVGPDKVVGVWSDGRLGIYNGQPRPERFGALVDGTKKSGPTGSNFPDAPLLVEVAKFFKSGIPPVSAEETIEVIAFLEAADESKRHGGRPVSIEEIIKRAEAEAAHDAK